MGKLYTNDKHTAMTGDSRRETLLYAALWLLLFLAPVMSMYIHHGQMTVKTPFPWHELTMVWRQMAVFLASFLLHNYVLAPLLIYRQRRVLYLSCIAMLLAIFVALRWGGAPGLVAPQPRHTEKSGQMMPPPSPGDFGESDHVMTERPGMPRPQGGSDVAGDFGKQRPPVLFGEHDIAATIIFILMIGMNLGVKLYFRQRKDQERMALLERQNLEQQLEYLKYQINPHFLMNTLNNIHALVDIDPEQAKETIVELSKIMRFVLYEGSKQKVPLRQELVFLQNYIELMKMRVSEQVRISVAMPDMLPDREIPPLMLITFVENAFKHGVSYRQKSFIDIAISIEGQRQHATDASQRLFFCCKNSKIPQGEDRHGGVGLQNIKRRLELLYGEDHTLDISDGSDTYTVSLSIPL